MRNLDNNAALFTAKGYKVWYTTNMVRRHIGENVEGEVEGLNGYQVTIIKERLGMLVQAGRNCPPEL
jgi:hypothetical protein